MTTQLPGGVARLSEQQESFLLRAAYGPTLTFRPRRTRWLAELLDRGLLREHADLDANFSTLRLTQGGVDATTCILAAADTRRGFEATIRRYLRLPQLKAHHDE
jgi:hypothetical protein